MSTVSHKHDNDFQLQGRIEWVDAAKSIGIFLVVFGHSLGGMVDSGVLDESGWGGLTVRFLYAFHMPLFFFLAGMFVANSAHRTFHAYLANKASVIVYPYLLWSLMQGSTQILASRFTNNHFSVRDLLTIVYQPVDQYWFLYVIFIMYIIYWWIYHRHISDDTLLVIALALHLIESRGLIAVRWDVLHSFCSLLLYFALGAKAAETSFFTDLRMQGSVRLGGLAVIGYVLIAVGVAATVKLSDLPLLSAALAISGTIATIALAMLLARSPILSFARIPGVYSLEIYVAHTFFAATVRIALQKGLGYSGPLLHVVIGTTAGIVFPVLLAIWAPKVGLPYLFTWSRSRRYTEMSAIKTPAA